MTLRRWRILLSLAAYAIAWFVPAYANQAAALSINGATAFLFSLSAWFDRGAGRGGIVDTLIAISACTNALYLVVLWRLSRAGDPAPVLRWALLAATLLNACWPVFFVDAKDLRIGYYLWWAAFALLAWDAFAPATVPTSDHHDAHAHR